MKKYQIIFGALIVVWLFLTFSLTASASIEKPTLSSPNDDILTDDDRPTFEWTGVENADNYRLVIDDDSNWSDENVYDKTYNTLSEEIGNSLADGNYWWKVAAENISEENWSSVRTFEIDTITPAIENITVSNIEKDSATIAWDTDEDSDSTVKYGTSDDYGESESKSTLTKNHSIQISGLNSGTTYHYKVKSADEVGNGNSSTDYTFTTLALPTSFVDSLDNYWIVTENIEITASANDEDGNVESVTLFYRFQDNYSANWSSWENYGVDSDNSDNWTWCFTSPENDGFYELYTQAIDDDDLLESTSGADENLGFDTSPPSVLSIRIDEDNLITTDPFVEIDIGAEDETSGLDQMRFRIDNQDWKDWKPFDNKDNHYFLPPCRLRTIYVQVKDSAGLVSVAESDFILLENATFTKAVGSINENENKSVSFTGWGLLVKEIKLCAEENTSDIEIGLRVENEKPSEITGEKPAPLVKEYFKIETNCEVENFKQIHIEFNIENSWLNEEGIEPEGIEVWRFENKWKTVETEIIGENSTHVTYRATTPNLSWFAVAKKTGSGLIWKVLAVIIATAAGIVLFYLYGWPRLESYLKSSQRSRSKGIPT